MCRWQRCPRALGSLLGAGSLCGDSLVMGGSLALSLESLQDLPDSRAALFLLSQDKLPKGRGSRWAQTARGQSCISLGGRRHRRCQIIPSWLEDVRSRCQ